MCYIKDKIDSIPKQMYLKIISPSDWFLIAMLVMAFPVVEFSRKGYKIRKVFG